MNAGAGSLAIAARRSGSRTVLERIRYDGISRCSRAFAQGAAARVVLSQLGPGVVRGDAVTTRGHVQAGAHLIVTSQASTRVLGGTRRSSAQARWTVDDRAVLEIIGEPLVATPDARYDAATSIDLGLGSYVLISDVACVGAGASVRLGTSIRRAGTECYYDAFEPAAAAPHAVGTFAVIGVATDCIDPLVTILDREADGITRVSVGVGGLRSGAFVRVLGTDVWSVRSALIALRAAAWTALRSLDDSGPAVADDSNRAARSDRIRAFRES